jgi:hypothetical protein
MRAVPVETPRWDRWTIVAFVLLVGYLTFTRSFAYLGLPVVGVPVPLYVGEAVLLAFLVFKFRESLSRLFSGMVMRTSTSAVSWTIYLFMAYGLFETFRGVYLDSLSALTALQTLVFNIYPLFFFFGLWIGERYPTFLRTFIWALAWVGGIYGIAWILVLTRVIAYLPGSAEVPIFGQPASAYVAIFGLLCFESMRLRTWIPLLLNGIVLLALQVRGGWAGFLLGMVAWTLITKRFGRVGVAATALAGLLLFSYVFDITLPATGRGNRGDISARNIVAAVVAPFDRETAVQYSSSAGRYAGTAEWRTDWWRAIWRSVHDDPVRFAIGHGYGFPLRDLVPFLEEEIDLRTPHNVFFYALGYGGWIGVLLFVSLLVTLARLQWRAYQVTGNPFGFVFMAVSIGVASFGDFFETPFGGIPFFLIVGLCASPVLLSERRETSDTPEPRPVATTTFV